MSTSTQEGGRFQFTGGLDESAIYVGRNADRELAQQLRAGTYCHVVGPRHIGKTSMAVRVARRLRRADVGVAVLDLSPLVGAEDADGWYFALAQTLSEDVGCPPPIETWDQGNSAKLPPALRWRKYVTNVVLEGEGQVVIIVDELQAIRRVPKVGDFFNVVRELHEHRRTDVELLRLSFCFLSVIQPSALSAELSASPFDITQPIELSDFTRPEIAPLRNGLSAAAGDPDLLLDEVFRWTDGHPYMTMRLCSLLASKTIQPGKEALAVDAAVQDTFLRRPMEDPALGYTSRRLSDTKKQVSLAELTSTYKAAVTGQHVPSETRDDVQLELKLSGLMKETLHDGKRVMRCRNDIYSSVFDEAWVRQMNKSRLVADALWQWQTNNRPDEALLRGKQLERALEWSKSTSLTRDEREFLDLSVKIEHSQIAKDSRRRRQITAVIGLLSIALAAAGIIYARDQMARAAAREARAEQMQERAVALQRKAKQRSEDAQSRVAEAQRELRETEEKMREALSSAEQAGALEAAAIRSLYAARRKKAQVESQLADLEAAKLKARQADLEAKAVSSETAELLKQAGEVSRGGGADIEIALSSVQKRATGLARRVGALEAESMTLASDLNQALVCRLVIEAQLGGGMQLGRMQQQLKKAGLVLTVEQVAKRVIDASKQGLLCPTPTGWGEATRLIKNAG